MPHPSPSAIYPLSLHDALPILLWSAVNGDAHGASGTSDDRCASFDVTCVEVVLLGLCNFLALIPSHGADLVGMWNAGALLDACSLQQQLSCWWGLQRSEERRVGKECRSRWWRECRRERGHRKR